MEAFRTERSRCKRYVYGDQWEDRIDAGGRMMTEREFIMEQGQIPLKNNILRRILRNVIGLYRSQYAVPELKKSDSALTPAEVKELNRERRRWFRENRMEELSPRLLEEFLISGLAVVKLAGGKIHPVTPDNFFFHSDGYDPRGWNVDLIGEVHQVSFGSLLSDFCRTPADFQRIRALYGEEEKTGAPCRAIEVWHKETRVLGAVHDERHATLSLRDMQEIAGIGASAPERGEVRSVVASGWRRVWYAGDGSLLRDDGLAAIHPYIYKAYPFLDGEIHSYISDIIDQQRYVNRLITLYDFIMRSSAKGVLLFLVLYIWKFLYNFADIKPTKQSYE